MAIAKCHILPPLLVAVVAAAAPPLSWKLHLLNLPLCRSDLIFTVHRKVVVLIGLDSHHRESPSAKWLSVTSLLDILYGNAKLHHNY